jgi:hypothetical protein
VIRRLAASGNLPAGFHAPIPARPPAAEGTGRDIVQLDLGGLGADLADLARN